MSNLVLIVLAAFLLPPLDDEPAPLPGWAMSAWAGGQLQRGHAMQAALDVPSGGRVHPELPAGPFGVSFSSELPVTPGQKLRFALAASGGQATLHVRDDAQYDLASVASSDGLEGHSAWFTPEGERIVLELVYQGGAEGARLSLALEPVDVRPGLAGCVVPAVFRDEAMEALAAATLGVVPDEPSDPPAVLFLTQSAGFRHEVVVRPSPQELSLAERGLLAAAGDRYRVQCTQDARELMAKLDTLDAVMFYTTGELPLDEAERQRLLDWVADGGAFVGVHCATDTMYASPDYLEMLGGTFDGHPWHEPVRLRVDWPAHPAVAHLGASWSLTDEIYQFRDFRRFPDAVLLSLDGSSTDLAKGKRADGDYANAWCKPWGRGRVFYTALGHRPELWSDEGYLRHLLGGLEWALHGPDLPVPAPADARVLVGGPGDRQAWRQRNGAPFAWNLVDGVIESRAGAGDLVSRQAFGDALIHVEFQLPVGSVGDEGRGNSGVYVGGVYELQVIDPTTGDTPAVGTCGAIYGLAGPTRDAIREAGRWQTYDIRYRAPHFDAGGVRTQAARLSLWHNGIPVHVDVELPGVTPGGLRDTEMAVGPLMLQDHGDPVRFRNVWVAPLDG